MTPAPNEVTALDYFEILAEIDRYYKIIDNNVTSWGKKEGFSFAGFVFEIVHGPSPDDPPFYYVHPLYRFQTDLSADGILLAAGGKDFKKFFEVEKHDCKYQITWGSEPKEYSSQTTDIGSVAQEPLTKNNVVLLTPKADKEIPVINFLKQIVGDNIRKDVAFLELLLEGMRNASEIEKIEETMAPK